MKLSLLVKILVPSIFIFSVFFFIVPINAFASKEVFDLQTFLEFKGLLVIPKGDIKGNFGPLTKSALIKYQRSVGLPSAGIFGPQTKAKIAAEFSTTSSVAISTTSPYIPSNKSSVSKTDTPSDQLITESVLNDRLQAIYRQIALSQRLDNISNTTITGASISNSSISGVHASSVDFTPNGTGAVSRTLENKLQDILNVKDFGAKCDGVTDDAVAIQSALTAAATMATGDLADYGSTEVVFPPSSTCRVNSGLTIDTNKVKVNGNGVLLNFGNMTTGTAITISQSTPYGPNRTRMNYAHPIEGLHLAGPGVAVTAVTALVIEDTGGWIQGVTVRDSSFVNFAKDVYLGSGAFFTTFDHVEFEMTGGTPTTYSITIPSGVANAGERNTFINCTFVNRDLVLNQSNPNADTYFINTSIDGGARLFTITGGSVFGSALHIEISADSDYWFYVSGANTILDIANSSITIPSGKLTSPFYSDSTVTNGGVLLTNIFLPSPGMNAKLVDGTGRTSVRHLSHYANSQPVVISAYQNYIAHGGFEEATYTGEWTLGSGAVRSSAQAHAGTYSLSFPAAIDGVTPSAYLLAPIQPGQNVGGSLWYKVSGITGTNGTFYVQIDYLDKGGNSLSGSAQIAQLTDVSSWTLLNVGFTPPAPAGTVNYRLLIDIFGVGSGTPTGYVDDVTVTVN